MLDDAQRLKIQQELAQQRESAHDLSQRAILARSAAARVHESSVRVQAAMADGRLGTRHRTAAGASSGAPNPTSSLLKGTTDEVTATPGTATGAASADLQLLEEATCPPDQTRLLDLAFDAIFARSITDGTIVSWNQGAERLFGWTREEAVGSRAADLLSTEFPEPLEEIERSVRATGRWEGQLAHRAKDGSRVRVASRWAAAGDSRHPSDLILMIESDVTAKLDADRQLDEMHELFRLLVSNVQDYALFLLDTQGRVMSWNEGARRIKQYTQAEVIGRHFSIFYEPEQVAAGKPDRALAMTRQEGRYEDEGWRVRKDGTRFWADVVMTALRDGSGELRGFAKITRDRTEKHRESERLMALEATKTQFLRLASHELRGPLGTLRGYTSLLREGMLEGRAAEKARAYEVLDDKAQHLTWLVNQMLETARLEEGRLELTREHLDLRSMVGQAFEETRVLAPDSHELVLDTPTEPVLVTADRLRAIAVIHNLLDNAVKFSPHGGRVRCRVTIEGETAVVEVQDHGLGIAAADMPTLFTRFGRIVTPENSHISGAGLGLYFCQELAHMHGGEITVDSEPGKGSTFRLTLPLVRGPLTNPS